MIVDYKTGKPQRQEDADDSLQLSIYALAAREKWGYEAEQLVFYNLEENSAVATLAATATRRSAVKVEDVARRDCGGGLRSETRLSLHCSAPIAVSARQRKNALAQRIRRSHAAAQQLKVPAKKLRGRFWRPPFVLSARRLSVSFPSSLPSSWLPLIYSPFPLFMDYATVFCCNYLNV